MNSLYEENEVKDYILPEEEPNKTLEFAFSDKGFRKNLKSMIGKKAKKEIKKDSLIEIGDVE